uniref:Ent-copalyl diphosphate synthase n=1 Tax=Selaginella wallacei TaxID=189577 RepID=A0A8U0DCA5_9TRAC|nr:ent-copalyl diphosphate synthase [Selaginella wallacei]
MCSSASSPAASNRFQPIQCSIQGLDQVSRRKTAPLKLLLPPRAVQESSGSQTATWTTKRTLPEQQEVQRGSDEIWELIERIKRMFQAMGDGKVSISAYDTAWVARVPALDGRDAPQFPEALRWITKHQLADGSWGDKDLFLAYDRVCSTLACIVALRTWRTGERIIAKGVEFIKGTMAKMETEDSTHMPIGFEIVFPAMVEEARELGLDIQDDAPVLQRINAEREKKLQRIPMDVLHSHPTTLLHSLEGLHKLVDWQRIMKLQSPDGSFLFSPASTACALMHTGDERCLQYIKKILEDFNGGVPNVYPVDLFEHVWIVDRLQRLGIARYFKQEIRDSLDYVYRYWTDKGIGWARESPVQDVDDTAMAFRLLRMHGYDVSPGVFENFQKGSEFFCFSGQAGQAVTGMYNLFRASQVRFPKETILQQAYEFSKDFLSKKQEKNELIDKWIIMKDIPGEVDFALNYPFLSSLQRVETRRYLEQYGTDDVWIGKSLYRMPYVNNQAFLALAKADYNLCQSLHRKELQRLKRWYQESKFSLCNFSLQKLVETYFSAAATIFEPELEPARIIWSQCWLISILVKEYFSTEGSVCELSDFVAAIERWNPIDAGRNLSSKAQLLFMGLFTVVNEQGKQGLMYQGRDITQELQEVWHKWAASFLQKAKWKAAGYQPSMEEYIPSASSEMEPAVRSTLHFVGENISAETARGPGLLKLMNITASLVDDIQEYKDQKGNCSCCSSIHIYSHDRQVTGDEALTEVQKVADEYGAHLLYETLHSTELPSACNQLFLAATRVKNLLANAKSSCRVADKMYTHVQRVLFESAV